MSSFLLKLQIFAGISIMLQKIYLDIFCKLVINIKSLYIILGNGFTIDFVDYMNKKDEINVTNLFKCGNRVPWPVDGEPSFLSYKRCQNLWNLGAKPSMSDSESIQLIEDIITCANVVDGGRRNDDNIYIRAYKELAIYLKHLFIYYDNKITDTEINSKIAGWNWYKYIEKVYNSPDYGKIIVVTYNYDIWLERILKNSRLKFNIGGVQRIDPKKKITIYKPHGSISFVHKKKLDKSSFEIGYKRDLSEGRAAEFKVKYSELDEHYLINAMIPPAGDSGRLQFGWASLIRNKALAEAKNLCSTDEVIVCGLSYLHVDRTELDELLTSINPEVTLKLINPHPPRTLNSVLCSLFRNNINYTNSEVLGG